MNPRSQSSLILQNKNKKQNLNPNPKKESKSRHSIKFVTTLGLILLIPLISGISAKASTLEDLTGGRTELVQLLMLLTVLALVPSIVILMTGFTRIIIVLTFVRNALGLQQTPPNQVLLGLALILDLFFMAPIIDEIKTKAYTPYINNQITQEQAIEEAMVPMRGFMLKQTYKKDLELFMGMANIKSVPSIEDIPDKVIIPAFITSELKRAFQIGFFIFIPFLIIDMIVASVLMAMGMMMLPPTVISLPFKILLFVLVDGWSLVITTLFNSFA